MKNIRRPLLTTAILCLGLLSLAACGKDQPPVDGETAETRGDTVAETVTEAAPETPGETDEVTAPVSPETEPETEPAPEPEPTLTVPAVYPVPRYMSAAVGESASAVRPERFSLNENGAVFARLLTAAGATVGEQGFPVDVTYRDLSADFEPGAEEAYILTVTREGVRVEAQTERGAFYAMTTLCDLLEKSRGALPVITVKDAPHNPLRGVIEGFYGRSYTHEFRKELFGFMGENKMNVYVYAPKDDAKHRAQWRELYSGEELEIMTDLITTARQSYVKFMYAISPGGDIDLGDGYDRDFDKLVEKCQQMYDLGVRDFAIFLDDIESRDAEGHAKLLNDFQARFVETHEGVSDLVAITAEYTDSFLTEYTDTIGPLIHEDVELMWTGPGVSPEKIAKPHLNKIIRKYGREVFIWWNYPVNDILINNLYMGACEGLASNLHESISGLVANPMNQGYASMIPLFTTADYLWNSEAYDPEASLRTACESLMPDAAEAMLNFIDMTCSSPMNKYTDSRELSILLRNYQMAPNAENAAALRAYFGQMIANADLLAQTENQAVYLEIADWVVKYRAMGVMGIAYVDLETAYGEGRPRAELMPLLGAYKAAESSIQNNARLVSPGVLAPFLDALSPRLNEICGFDAAGTVGVPVITTSLPTYGNNTPDLACDGLEVTFFWSGRAGLTGDYMQLDLGAPIAVDKVIFNARNSSAGEADYIRSGELSYSVDGTTWIPICAVTQPANEVAVNVTARYLRVTVTADQVNWVTVSEFSVVSEDMVPDNLSLDEYFIPRNSLIALRDNRIFTALEADGEAAEGHSLLAAVGDTGRITLLSYALPEETVYAVIRNRVGEEIGRVALGYETVITAPAGSVAEIPLGRGLRIAEVY